LAGGEKGIFRRAMGIQLGGLGKSLGEIADEIFRIKQSFGRPASQEIETIEFSSELSVFWVKYFCHANFYFSYISRLRVLRLHNHEIDPSVGSESERGGRHTARHAYCHICGGFG
jgi:hypothetical protein